MKTLLIIATGVALKVYQSYAIVILWGWFITQQFNITAPPLLGVLGLIYFFGLFNIPTSQATKDTYVFNEANFKLFYITFSLVFGFIVHWFM